MCLKVGKPVAVLVKASITATGLLLLVDGSVLVITIFYIKFFFVMI